MDVVWLLLSLSLFVILIVCPVLYQVYHAVRRVMDGRGL
jgi:hypothetical protein